MRRRKIAPHELPILLAAHGIKIAGAEDFSLLSWRRRKLILCCDADKPWDIGFRATQAKRIADKLLGGESGQLIAISHQDGRYEFAHYRYTANNLLLRLIDRIEDWYVGYDKFPKIPVRCTPSFPTGPSDKGHADQYLWQQKNNQM